MYRNDMYDYLKEHAYISKNKKSNYQFELSKERAECIANKFHSLVTDLYQNLWLCSIQELEQENQELKKQLEERDKWLSICILELMKEYKTDTVWITNQQIENVKDKNISYEVYGGNDIKFYQNIKK